MIASARARVALYGSPEVVVAMSKTFKYGSALHSPEARQDLSATVAAMRADVIWIDPVAPRDALFVLLYGEDRIEGRLS